MSCADSRRLREAPATRAVAALSDNPRRDRESGARVLLA
jgi:hypothetical protein